VYGSEPEETQVSKCEKKNFWVFFSPEIYHTEQNNKYFRAVVVLGGRRIIKNKESNRGRHTITDKENGQRSDGGARRMKNMQFGFIFPEPWSE